MAVRTKKNRVNPLNWKVPIANKDGTPTPEFMQKWTQQATANAGVPDLTTAAALSALLDTLGFAQGDILYRDTTLWKVLAPGTTGFILKTAGVAANPAWESVSAAIDTVGTTQGNILYRNGSVWTVLAPGTDGQLLQYDAGTHAPKWSSFSGVVLGSGVPSTPQPIGTLYSRTDAPGVYSSQLGSGASAAIVQHKAQINGNSSLASTSVFVNSAPVPGNLVLAFISFGDNNSTQPPIDAAKWTSFLTIAGTGSNIRGFAVYRYAQVGDTTTLPFFCTAGPSNYSAVSVYEISGVTGTFASDVVLAQATGQTGSATMTTAAQVATIANSVVLIAGGQYNGNTNPTISAGWTYDDSAHNATFFGSVVNGSQTVSISGTAVSGTLTFSGTTNNTTAFQALLVGTPAAVNVWTLIGPAPAQTVSTRQILTTGSGATYTTPVGVRQLRIRMVAGGGGGGGSGTGTPGNGSPGTDTIFNAIHAAPGQGASGNANAGGIGGTGGTGSASFRAPGSPGATATGAIVTSLPAPGEPGASSLLGGGGASSTAAPANTGGGGGGAGVGAVANAFAGGGGGSGEYVELIINNPAPTYIYTIGAPGAGGIAGTSGNAGFTGGSGLIIVDEYY